MKRTLIISCIFSVVGLSVATSQDADGYSKRIRGKWSSSRSGALSVFHGDGSWSIERDHETPAGRWWIKGNKLFLTYRDDNGLVPESTFELLSTRLLLPATIDLRPRREGTKRFMTESDSRQRLTNRSSPPLAVPMTSFPMTSTLNSAAKLAPASGG